MNIIDFNNSIKNLREFISNILELNKILELNNSKLEKELKNNKSNLKNINYNKENNNYDNEIKTLKQNIETIQNTSNRNSTILNSRIEKIIYIKTKYNDLITNEIESINEKVLEYIHSEFNSKKIRDIKGNKFYKFLIKFMFGYNQTKVQEFILSIKNEGDIFSIEDKYFKEKFEKEKENITKKSFEKFIDDIFTNIKFKNKEKNKKEIRKMIEKDYKIISNKCINLILDMKTCDLIFYSPKDEKFNPILYDNRTLISYKIKKTFEPTIIKGNYKEWKEMIIIKGDVSTKLFNI